MKVTARGPSAAHGATQTFAELSAETLAHLKDPMPDVADGFWDYATRFEIESLNGLVPTCSQLEGIAAEVASDPNVPFRYITSGCVERAKVAQATLAKHGVNHAAVQVARYPVSANPDSWVLGARNDMMSATWSFHFAPVVIARDDAGTVGLYVIDPALDRDEPLFSLRDWLTRIAPQMRRAPFQSPLPGVNEYVPELVFKPLPSASDKDLSALRVYREAEKFLAEEPRANVDPVFGKGLSAKLAHTMPTTRDFVLHNYQARSRPGDPTDTIRFKPRDGSRMYDALVREEAKRAEVIDIEFASDASERDKTRVTQAMLEHLSLRRQAVKMPDQKVHLAMVSSRDVVHQFQTGALFFEHGPNTPYLQTHEFGASPRTDGRVAWIPYRGINARVTLDGSTATLHAAAGLTQDDADTLVAQVASEQGWEISAVQMATREEGVPDPAADDRPFLESFLSTHNEQPMSRPLYPVGPKPGGPPIAAVIEAGPRFAVREIAFGASIPPANYDALTRDVGVYAAHDGQQRTQVYNEFVAAFADDIRCWVVEPNGDAPRFSAVIAKNLDFADDRSNLVAQKLGRAFIKELRFAADVTDAEKVTIRANLVRYLKARGWADVVDGSEHQRSIAVYPQLLSLSRRRETPVRRAPRAYWIRSSFD